MTLAQKRLEAAGFKVLGGYGGGWFRVTTPDNRVGVVLCQSAVAWHFFNTDFVETASGSSPDRCHVGGLGNALNTDSQVRTYKRLLHPDNVPRDLHSHKSVYAAMSQVANEA